MQDCLHTIYVRQRPGFRSQGWLIAGGIQIPVAIGRGGILANKREGDGGTPRGIFRLVRLWWRSDRTYRPRTFLPVRRIGKHDGWTEDPRCLTGPRAIAFGARMGSTISLLSSTTIPARGSPAVAARCLFTWRGKGLSPRLVAWHCRSRGCDGCWNAWDRKPASSSPDPPHPEEGASPSRRTGDHTCPWFETHLRCSSP